MRAIAIIPAKGYSRRIPRKNMREFKAKPLIDHTIDQALALGVHAVVSTDDPEIEAQARQHDVTAIRRPHHLCRDSIHAVEATLHALRFYLDYDYVVQLLPTSPFRTADTIKSVLNLSMAQERNVLTVTSTGKVPAHGRLQGPGGELRAISAAQNNFQFDPQGEMYLLNGAVSCAPIKDLLKHRTFQYGNPLGYVMSKREAWELDTEEDWEIGERL